MKIEELKGRHKIICTACMSVWADALSWANANPNVIADSIEEAENVIILSCQVTDLAILNDFRTAEHYRDKYPTKNIFISGCLAKRNDIEFPPGIKRLEQMRCAYQPIHNKDLVEFAKPFWVKNFEENEDEFSQGNLFRNKYPLRIGKGCLFNCTYCTIRVTRGEHEQYDIDERLISEFLAFKDVVLIADSPTAKQIKDWCKLAFDKNKPISIRNIEPQIAMECRNEIILIAAYDLLEVLHCPIQSNNVKVLADMQRNVKATLEVIELSKKLQSFGVKTATNIITDYKDFPNDYEEIFQIYDYVSENPYWDGKWDRAKAESRFQKYIF